MSCETTTTTTTTSPRRGRPPIGPDRPVPPCTVCGTTGGRVPARHRRPLRHGGAPYGLEGVLCHTCEGRLRRGRAEALRAAAADLRVGACEPLPAPCTTCGTTGGRARRLRGRPIRYDGRRAGLAGPICHACATADRAIARAIFRPPDRSALSEATAAADPECVRRRARAILERRAAKGDALEAARLRGVGLGPATTPRAGARQAIRLYKATMFGPLAFPGMNGGRG